MHCDYKTRDDARVSLFDYMYRIAKKCGFADQMFKNIKVEDNLPVAEDILREMNRGSWSTGYCGQSPERIKSHMANQADFDMSRGPNLDFVQVLLDQCFAQIVAQCQRPHTSHRMTPFA